MAKLTIFISPKPFSREHIAIIQKNAISSWLQLAPEVKVILIGDDEGVAEAAAELNILHLPGVIRNELGTPLLSSIFQLAREHSNSPYLAYVNADIILFNDFIEVINLVERKFSEFLIIGQRWDLNVDALIDFENDWASKVKQDVNEKGKLHPPGGSDYFIYPRACFEQIPEFAIGRAGWDNWMIFKARQEGWPVVDATNLVDIIHQNHDYAHLPDGQSHYRLPETAENVRLAGGSQTVFTIHDADYEFRDNKLEEKQVTWKKFWREVEIFPLVKLRSIWLSQSFFFVFHPQNGFRRLKTWLRKLIKE
ncbi:MAG: hypothetical protein JEZ06_01195 [Anaerolineaceae bacterium]|nr:hypothetical protein [Anaerolineaceae bacterium]